MAKLKSKESEPPALRTSLDLPAPVMHALEKMAAERYEARAVIIRELIVKGLKAEGYLQ